MRTARNYRLALAAALLAAAAPAPDSARPTVELSYADLADLALAAPVAAHVRVLEALPVKDERAPGLRPGFARFLVEAELVSLIGSPAALPARLSFLADFPRDAKGKAAKPRKKSELLLLAAPVEGKPGQLRLVAADAHFPFTPARAARLRTLVKEAAAPDAAPRIVGVGRAFHVPGAIRGESESQIFLETANRAPVSLSVLRRPGEKPQWAAALSEVVDEAAARPAHGTLLWYRLACGLPRRLPAASLGEADAAARAALEADYALVLAELGPCTRTRPAR